MIESLTLTSSLANQVLRKIREVNDSVAAPLLGVARILLDSRGCSLYINKSTGYLDQLSDIADFNNISIAADDGLKRIENDIFGLHRVSQEFLDEMKANTDAVCEILGDGFRYMKVPSEYLSKYSMTNAVCFVNFEKHVTLIFVRHCTASVQSMIASSLPAFLPWVFKDNPVTQEEIDMLRALADPSKYPSEFVSRIEAMSEARYDWQSLAKRQYLQDFESSLKDGIIRDLRERIDSLVSDIRSLNSSLARCYESKSTAELELCGLINADVQSGAIMEYFIANKKLYVVPERSDTSSIVYIVSGYMDQFDPEVYGLLRDNPGSYLYSGYGHSNHPKISQEEYLLLMDALFKDEKVKLKICSAWRLTPSSISPIEHYNYPEQFTGQYIPNAHLDRYGCTGGFGTHLSNAIMSHDYVMAVDITSAENGNINLNDSVVIPNEFIPRLVCSDRKIIELPDGSSATVKEAVEYLKEANSNGETD